MLGVEPGGFIQHSVFGWVAVRLVVLVYAAVVAALTFTEGNIAPVKGEVVQEMKNLKTYGYNSLDKICANAPLFGWTAAWVIATQLMASFYISDWCAYGF
jgi:hypothetical protein